MKQNIEDCNHVEYSMWQTSCSLCGKKNAKHVSEMSREELIHHLLRYKSIIVATRAYFQDLWERHPEIVKNGHVYTCSYLQALHDAMEQASLF